MMMNGERFIELRKDDKFSSFGFNIKGGYDTGCPVYVWRVEPGSIADRYGLKSGDEILQANGIDFTRIEHGEALKILKGQHTLCLYVKTHGETQAQQQHGIYTHQPSLDEDQIIGNAEFYTWVDRLGAPVSPPVSSDSWTRRNVEIEIQPGQNLGLMIRGGSEYGLGIYVTGVDPGSVAERAGLQRGDEIIEVNGRQFTSITHDKAVAILKSSRKMSIVASFIGKIPADLTFEPQVKVIEDDIDKCTNVLAMIEEKARTVLTKSEHSRFTFYRVEYQQGFLPVHTFVRILLELLSTHEKYTLLTEVREIIRPADRPTFDELIYKPVNASTPGLIMDMDYNGLGDRPNNNTSSDLVFLREFNSKECPPGSMANGPMARSPNGSTHCNFNGDGRSPQQQIGLTNNPAVRFRVRIPKSKPILGIAIEGGSNTPHRLPRIIDINPDGSAVNSSLKPGQVILSVDGKKLDGFTHEDIARIITDSFTDQCKPNIEFMVVEAKPVPGQKMNGGEVIGGGGPGGVGGGEKQQQQPSSIVLCQ